MSDAAPAKRKFGIPSFGNGERQTSPFAKSLGEGLIAGGIVFALMVGWMVLRADDTAQSIQPMIPATFTMIEVPVVTQQDPNAPDEKLENAKTINALPPAPIEGLSESRDGKILPLSRMQDDMTPFQAYKKPFTPIAGRSLVSIVVVDFGLSEKISTSLLDNLPDEISFVMNPYAANAPKWASAARAYGHEFWLSLPMQTDGAGDSGQNALLHNAPLEQNEARLLNVLGTAVGYAGLVTQKDHMLKSDDAGAAPLLKQIFGRGLAMAESTPDIPAYGLSAAMQSGYPYVQNNLWLDADLRPEAIDRSLQALELQATRKGKAIAFLRPYPVVIRKVQEWAGEAESRGLQIAPLSAMVQ